MYLGAVICVVALIFRSVTAKPEYMGCYFEDYDNIQAPHLYVTFFLTPEICIDYCRVRSYFYAELKLWYYCYCENEAPLESKKESEGDCWFSCRGDSSSNCGGFYRKSVYKTGYELNPDYMGCYSDGSVRMLDGDTYKTDNMTPQVCVDFCRMHSFVYAGIQNRNFCYCGNKPPLVSDRKPDSMCWAECPGDSSHKCGGLIENSIYKSGYEHVAETDPTTTEVTVPTELTTTEVTVPTELTTTKVIVQTDPMTTEVVVQKDPMTTEVTVPTEVTTMEVTTESPIECVKSVTTVNGEPTCSGDVIFEESFDTVSSTKWKHDIKIPRMPDYLYVVYDANPDNSYISNGKLVIKPILLPTDQVARGTLALKGCTGDANEYECGYTAKYYFVLPPVQSARLTTRESFNFRYGKMEITAKLPLGDWLVPEIWLEPKKYVYGAENTTWRIRIAMSRGNRDLKTDQYDRIGCTLLENFVTVGFGNKLKKLTAKKEHKDGWYKDYHNYTLFWRPGNIVFLVDGEVLGPLIDENGFSADIYKLSTFDSEHYISLGLYAGGSTDFPDDSMNNGGEQKPWNNTDPKAMAKFWSHSNSWKATWNDDLALLQVDHIKVTAL